MRQGLTTGQSMRTEQSAIRNRSAFAPQPNIALQLTPTASLLVPCASLRRR